ncbi:MAG: sulfite reductase subunit alpha [Betaproteobacteria bacterium]|nr:MAG: sulfite reductase subunit alpha [Betaproteobacteria bacterium]
MQQLVFLPDNAPFTEPQRAWLNGFVAGLLGMERTQSAPGAQAAAPAAAPQIEEDFPWHDPTLALDERMKLATGRPLERRLMAAMGQLDCGQCGYLCKTYAESIAGGTEADLGKCVPGGRATAKKLKELLVHRPSAPVTRPAPIAVPVPVVERGYGRAAPVPARLISSTPLTAPGSEREVRHVAFELDESGLLYEPGDSLGIWPHNNPDEVELLIAILRAKGSEAVTLSDGAVVAAREALGRECDLRAPSDALYALLAREAKDEADRSRLSKLAEDDSRAEGLGVHDVLDALLEFPSARPSIVEFAAALGRMQPRLYSIACSQKRHPREVHLAVSVLRYEKNDRSYLGTGSGLLSEHLRPGRTASVFVQRAHAFRLPADLAAQVIMVGPGTGIAPFRAFLQERAAAGAAGRNWLFFGNHRREGDFLYRTELEEFAVKRVLSRMDLAFSRDQTNKVYVQHKMLEAAQELWRWLANGAYLYVCGDAQRMAGDVDLALQQIAVTQGGMDGAAAKRFLVELAKAGRYQRDVY